MKFYTDVLVNVHIKTGTDGNIDEIIKHTENLNLKQIDIDLIETYKQWCEEHNINISMREFDEYSEYLFIHGVDFIFENPKDEMFFKLRWG
jgi:hypothetical protein